jgi:hypothetical protein
VELHMQILLAGPVGWRDEAKAMSVLLEINILEFLPPLSVILSTVSSQNIKRPKIKEIVDLSYPI